LTLIGISIDEADKLIQLTIIFFIIEIIQLSSILGIWTLLFDGASQTVQNIMNQLAVL